MVTAMGTVTLRSRGGHPDWSRGHEGVKDDDVKKRVWSQAKASGLYSRGSEEPPKVISKL